MLVKDDASIIRAVFEIVFATFVASFLMAGGNCRRQKIACECLTAVLRFQQIVKVHRGPTTANIRTNVVRQHVVFGQELNFADILGEL